MKTKKTILGMAMVIALSAPAWAQDGEQLFRGNCGYCHTVGKGMLTGPDLLGATNRHTDKWLQKWIKSSSTMIQEGDKKAVALFEKYNQISMPDVNLSDNEINSIISFLKEKTAVASAKAVKKENLEKKADAAADNVQGVTVSAEPNVVATSDEQQAVPEANSQPASEDNKTILYLEAGFIVFLFIIIFVLINVIRTLSSELTAKYKRINAQKV